MTKIEHICTNCEEMAGFYTNNNGSHISFLKVESFRCNLQKISTYAPLQVFKPLFLSDSET